MIYEKFTPYEYSFKKLGLSVPFRQIFKLKLTSGSGKKYYQMLKSSAFQLVFNLTTYNWATKI